MRVLVLGGDGMLGHQFFKTIRAGHVARVTLRRPLAAYADFGLFDSDTAYPDTDVTNFPRVVEVFERFRPDAVVNCIGLVKQRDTAGDIIANLEINALLPQRLAKLCRASAARLIHVSTDCVFSGRKGLYLESDTPDAEDVYGRTKLLGEVSGEGCITLRTSLIGRELARKQGLIEWFLAQKGGVKGYRNAVFSGLTTVEFSRILKTILEKRPDAQGLYHVSSDPIDKYALLGLVRERFELNTEIVPDDTVRIDRSLDSGKFRKEFGYSPPPWPRLVEQL